MTPKKDSAVLTVLFLVLLVVPVYFFVKNMRDVELIISRAGIAGPMVAVLLYALFAITPISTDPLTVISGLMFGPFLGIGVSWIGNNTAALVEYYFGTHIGKATNFETARKKLPFGLGRFPVKSPWFLIFGRLIPGYGGKVISIIAGIHHVPIKRYIWTTALTNLLGSLLLSFGGYHFMRFIKHW